MRNKSPFGNLSLITVGDLFQLKPVFDKWIFENTNDSYGALATNIWKEYFTLFELTEIMRQKDDKDFAELLNRLGEGKHNQNDIKVLKERTVKLNQARKIIPLMKHIYTQQMHKKMITTMQCIKLHILRKLKLNVVTSLLEICLMT